MKEMPLVSTLPRPHLLMVLIVFLLCSSLCIQLVSSNCHDDEMSLLLEFKNNLTLSPLSVKLRGWKQGIDCCKWGGVECDNSTGRVTGLDLSRESISGHLNYSSSLFRLQFLKRLDLMSNSFEGSIPSSLTSLGLLECLDLSANYFSGPVPSFSTAKHLKFLILSNNNLNGSIPSSLGSLPLLQDLELANNQLSGPIPSFSSAKNLKSILLSMNQLNGWINSTDWGRLPKLEMLSLDKNYLEGPIPKSIFQLQELISLNLDSNYFSGTIKLGELLYSFKNLYHLHLSHNNLSIDLDGCGVNSSFPQLSTIGLASCNLHVVPEFLKNQTYLNDIDLSMNHISGTPPIWIWDIARISLNLSCNHLVKLEPPLALRSHDEPFFDLTLDLHSNNLQGRFPIVSSSFAYVDCSNNNFTSIDDNIGNHIDELLVWSFSRNNLYENILTTLCKAKKLEVLNLGYNKFDGTIPDCLISGIDLSLLDLRGNRIRGIIPDLFGIDCGLQTLNLNDNNLLGQIPQSLANCESLLVLDLGNNQFNDTFPCHLVSLWNLHVIVLRSNKLHGTMNCPQSDFTCPQLLIIDLADNHFIGELSAQNIFNWRSMTTEGSREDQSKLPFVPGSEHPFFYDYYYQNQVACTFKGSTHELEYILTTFTSIDFSSNSFHGKLPRELGNLNALIVLNLSHNSFSGSIPSTLGNLSQVESLDLSCNNFSGKIPAQLANLYFIGFLNLSFNKLSGKIPTSTQLQSFNASSYEGNKGLYGPPLTPLRPNPKTTPSTSPSDSNWSAKRQIEWMLSGARVGFPVGITIFLGPLLYIKSYREWYCKNLHTLVMKILRKEDNPRRMRRRSTEQRQPR